MNEIVQQIYYQLPEIFKKIGVNYYGYKLWNIRYGKETENLILEAEKKEMWNDNKLNNWQNQELLKLLDHARKNVKFYRDYWNRPENNNKNWRILNNWSITSKKDIQKNPKLFIADKNKLLPLFNNHTSGTTGTPLTIYFSKKSIRKWYALFETRWRNWYGLDRFDRWGNIGGQLIVPYRQNKPPFWIWSKSLNELFLSSYHLSSKNIIYYIEAIKKYQLTYLYGYPSSLESIAQEVIKHKIDIPKLAAIITDAEPLLSNQKKIIQKAFRCKVYETYGLTEMTIGASQCQYNKWHLWSDAGILEIVNGNTLKPVKKGQLGKFVTTGLINYDMPLIRYDTGDEGMLSQKNKCRCLRNLPILKKIEGRSDDIIVTPDGRRIGRLDPVFKYNLDLKKAQIIQIKKNKIIVKIIPDKNYNKKTSKIIIHELSKRLGNMKIKLVIVESIKSDANGKFRAVKSLINK